MELLVSAAICARSHSVVFSKSAHKVFLIHISNSFPDRVDFHVGFYQKL